MIHGPLVVARVACPGVEVGSFPLIYFCARVPFHTSVASIAFLQRCVDPNMIFKAALLARV